MKKKIWNWRSRSILRQYFHEIKDVEFIYDNHEQTFLSTLYNTLSIATKLCAALFNRKSEPARSHCMTLKRLTHLFTLPKIRNNYRKKRMNATQVRDSRISKKSANSSHGVSTHPSNDLPNTPNLPAQLKYSSTSRRSARFFTLAVPLLFTGVHGRCFTPELHFCVWIPRPVLSFAVVPALFRTERQTLAATFPRDPLSLSLSLSLSLVPPRFFPPTDCKIPRDRTARIKKNGRVGTRRAPFFLRFQPLCLFTIIAVA